MERLVLKARDQLKLDVIWKVEKGKLSRSDAEAILQVSSRTFRRYLKSYRAQGVGFLRHGNYLRKPKNKISNQLKSEVLNLMKFKYYDFNLLHAGERIYEELGVEIKRETFRRWCHEAGLVKKAHKRRSRPRKRRQRMSQPGYLVQMDGSPHRWFGGRESCLIATIDDATSEVLWAEFFESETTIGCLQVLHKVVEQYGSFKLLYTDKAGIFGGIKRSGFSQVQRALAEVGTDVIYAQSPEAKGRIERLFGTLQDRLVAEMRLNKIRTIEQANQFLQQVYLPHHHNPRFSVQAKNPISAYRPYTSKKPLDQIFCLIERRNVAKDHTISWQGHRYIIADELAFSIQNQKIEMRMNMKTKQWQAFFAEKPLTLKLIKKEKPAGATAA